MNVTDATAQAAVAGFEPFSLGELPFLFRRLIPGYGKPPAEDDRREWLRWTGSEWMGYSIHTDKHGSDWHESDTFYGTVPEISLELERERAKAPRLDKSEA